MALSSNEFMKLFTWLELGLVVFGLIRISAAFLSTPILPRYDPSLLSVLIFSMYIVLACFRYFAYLGIRITFIDPSNPGQNRLNKPLAQALEEKDQLLLGLIASNRVIGISALASSLAHQLSQPLTTIALRADTSRRDLLQSGQNLRFISSIEIVEPQLEAKKILLVKDYQSNPTVFGDTIQIQQVIINVMTNAIDALLESKAPQKEIRISF